ncbi:MAG: helix-turn-helix transcriptional regulator [Lachnospiraceae bacterium]|nr:helix-turn-helix transcriptional regulator [Lachnospiraceae bacterium]
MIESLKGFHETVNFGRQPLFKLYHNIEDEDYPPHWHASPEIIMPLKGGYNVTIGEDSYDLDPGDTMIITSGTIHTLKAPKKGERLIFQPDLSLITNLTELSFAMTMLSPATVIRSSDDPDTAKIIHDLMLSIESEYFSDDTYSGARIYSMLIEILVTAVRKYGSVSDDPDTPAGRQQEYSDKFFGICEYINSHFAEDLTLEDTAEMAGFSKFHFARLFKQFTGRTFYRYVNIRRIENAEILLSDPQITITEAATRSGFSSVPSFVRMFKLIKNCTPTQFRKMHDRR